MLYILCLVFICVAEAQMYESTTKMYESTTKMYESTTKMYESTTEMNETEMNESTTEISIDSKQAGYWSIPDINALGCGKDFSCIRFSRMKSTCSGIDCVYILGYKPPSEDYIEFFLAAKEAKFVAVGFTDDKRLVNTEFLTCSVSNDEVISKIYLWPGSNEKSELQEVSIPSDKNFKKISGEVEGNGLWCLIKIQLEPWETNILNFKNNYFQVYVWGDVDKIGHPVVGKDKLSEGPIYNAKISLAAISNMQYRIISEEIFPDDVNCEDINCVRFYLHDLGTPENVNCSYTDCSFLLAYHSKALSSRTWPIFLSASNAEFVAVGLTSDPTTKKKTEIFGCKKTKNGQIKIFHYWFSNPSQTYPQAQHLGLELKNGTTTGNGLWCNIVRPLQPGGNAWNLNDPTYQLYSWGSLKEDGEPAIWISNVYTSSSKVNLESNTHFYEQQVTASDSNVNVYSIILIIYSIIIHYYFCFLSV